MGIRFYSRLPFPGAEHEVPNLSRMAPALPLTSLLLGLLPALLVPALCFVGMPAYFAAALAVACNAILTGAMAEDAIADSADGLFGGHTIERRLEILKDSRHGTYGVTALASYFILRIVALGAIATVSPLAAAALWLAASISARSGSLWLTLSLHPARREGAAASAGRVTRMAFWIGMALALVLSLLLAAPLTSMAGFAVALILQALVALGWTRLCAHKIGGQTGDLIGALQALLEIAALSAFIIFAGA